MSGQQRRIVILGSTGSIGRQAIEVVRAHPDRFRVVALVAGHDSEALDRQSRDLDVHRTGVGVDAAVELAALDEADVVLNAIVGAAGLRASLVALEAGKVLALANKESLVAGGELCLRAATDGGGEIVPVDSEHAAIAQCLRGVDGGVARVTLTASGGPFRRRSDLDGVTPREALAHPTWNMGPKISIDSATMMNKALEVIEAHHLFGLSYDDIGVVVHPQSVVHGIVELKDGSLLLQAAPTDMRLPIQTALASPERLEAPVERLEVSELGALTFEAVDERRFRAVPLAYDVGRRGQSYPAVMNAANEVAVKAFLSERISFVDITRVVETVISEHDPVDPSQVESIFEADAWARGAAERVIASVDRSGVGRARAGAPS